ncbi:MAG: hotdog family protein [Methylococcales symbiont of Hymedesmia sp. n. MRB-2018]|nr:MAG: hotdog family protein [Methylococcales symbiont of Hymedesmia sp. n. MRB-2018]KAF3984221.1 MAG: hotdog family protein [Methylococcales symbiont of Hymedesmia sp. n. MRB-2018]
MINTPIEELIAHRGKMLLIDKVISFDHESLTSQVVVHNNGLFDNGVNVPAWLGMEYMAQTIGAYQGMMDKISNRCIQVGFLLGTRRYICNVPHFNVGSVLTVYVKRVIEDQGLGVFECKISHQDLLVEANINVYQPNSTQPL